MSIKDLFSRKPNSHDSATSSSLEVESYDYTLAKEEKNNKFVPRIDFSTASNFVTYGSAKEYYRASIERIYNFYPYDGSEKEKIQFDLSSSYLDDWILNNKYPRTNGFINFSYGGWGTQSSMTDGYGLPVNREYIYSRGGLHTASSGMSDKKLHFTFDKSAVYDATKNRTTNYRMNIVDGFTVEFWLKKDSFDISKTEKEVVLDLWNGELSSSDSYGRFTLALSGTTSGQDTFVITLQSGTLGFYEQTIGTSTVTTSSLSSWHHYALSFVSASNKIDGRLYVDGYLNEYKALGSTGLNEIEGLINGYIGALQTSPSGSSAAQYAGKLSGSLDEFRYWKKRRTSSQINSYWNRAIGGGANTDDDRTDLGVYYKFNEGIVGSDNIDSVVLDYSGRIANGTWTGYSSGARETGSAIVLSSASTSEFLDPIIYSSHPSVVSLSSEMELSGTLYDDENGNKLINKIPSWMIDEDEASDKNLIYLTQIIASYLDTLNSQVGQIKLNKLPEYYDSTIKPLPFAKNLLEDKGLIVSDILTNHNVLEYFDSRDLNGKSYANNLFDLKNLIYQNIYNNLNYIFKTKGTEKSIRNLLRCFGIDDEILKLNIYTDKGTHYITDKVKHTSVHKKLVDNTPSSHHEASVFQTSSANNTLTYIYGSDSLKKEKHNSFTLEINTYIPYKPPSHTDEYIYYGSFSSSIGGFHQAVSDSADYTWATSEIANLQMYIVRDELDSKGGYFLLKNSDNTLNLTSSYFKELYDNNLWTIAAKIKPKGYPFHGSFAGSPQPTYTLEFYGVSHKADILTDQFSVTASLNYSSGSSYLSNRKRVYIGAHHTNFTGSTIEKSDLKFASCRFYLDYLDDSSLNLHNRDITNYGTNKTFEGFTPFSTDMDDKQIPAAESLILNWDFETVTTSDSSGEYVVDDISSGSSGVKYGWLDNILNKENRGKGFNFSQSSTSVIDNNFIYASKRELPEISYTADSIKIKDEVEQLFIEDEDTSDNFYTLEKSMYQIISEQMLNTMASTSEMNNLFGKVIDRYRFSYKNLDYMRRMFFDRIEEDPDFDRFTEYFKWIDKSIYSFVEQLLPVSSRFNSKVSDVVESHIFERNKIRGLIPNKFVEASPDDRINAIRELSYNWKFGHAPIGGNENDNCLWQKERKEREDITDRETLRKVIVNDNGQTANTLAKSDGTTYLGSTYALRRFTRPYKESVIITKSLHGGTNYELQKNRRISKNLIEPHSKLNSLGIPKNVILIGAGPGQGVELRAECNDVLDPNYKEKYDVKAYLGKFAGGDSSGVFSPVTDTAVYSFGLKGSFVLPFNIISASVPSGYNKAFDEGWKQGSYITNVHSDTIHDRNDVSMQGPFTERWVGGHQSRHQDINRYDTTLVDGETLSSPPNNLHNIYTRPEGYRILLVESGGSSDGAVGMTDAQYGVTNIAGHPNDGKYPDVAKKKAVYFREETAKRPVNIKNIQTTTSSYSHGNYQKQYEILSVASGKKNNDPLFRNIAETHTYIPSTVGNALPKTTNYQTVIAFSSNANGNVFGAGASNVLNDTNQVFRTTGLVQKSVFTTRFSAPGGIETMTYGFLDAYSQEMSAYNALTYRNLLVRGSGSGETGTIRLNDHLGNRHGLLTHLRRFSGKFGSDSVYGSVTSGDYVQSPSYHKTQRNTARKVVSGSSLSSPTFNLDHDNGFVTSIIPRSDFQYTWITSSLGSNYSITSGKQRMFGYAPRDGVMSSSYEVHGETGYVAAITFPTASELFGE